MSKIRDAISEFGELERTAKRDQWVNHIHPLVMLFLTVLYIGITVSFQKYDLIGLAAMGLYPLVMFNLADLSFGKCLKRVRIVLPLILFIGLFNPLFDRVPVRVGQYVFRAGWISMITLIFKGFYTVLASYVLVATTPIEDLCRSLRQIHVPEILVTQLLLTYRYISVLLLEVHRTTQAYSLRAPGQRGVKFKAWGSLAGGLLLRSVDRAQVVYESMLLRGFDGTFRFGKSQPFRSVDIVFGLFWTAVFVLIRRFPVLVLIGSLFV
ncbi:MAG: cobalt ECF transporter T component CbiQ [Clostridiales bacterium]|nr:cobalt ECF transporter T component CbiQ [Clostridiales bacterium]